MTSDDGLLTSSGEGGQVTPAAIMEMFSSVASQESRDLSELNGVDQHVTLRLHEVPLTTVYEDLGRRAGFTVYFGTSADSLGTISVAVSDTTVHEVLELLAEDANIEYRVIDSETLAIRLRQEGPVEPVHLDIQERPAKKKVIKRTPASPAPVRVGGDIQEPEKIHHVTPAYTDEARRARQEGFVILEAVIDKEGNVGDVDVLRGLGMGLDEAAVEAVKQWKYTPTLYDGEPVEVVVTISVKFQLIR